MSRESYGDGVLVNRMDMMMPTLQNAGEYGNRGETRQSVVGRVDEFKALIGHPGDRLADDQKVSSHAAWRCRHCSPDYLYASSRFPHRRQPVEVHGVAGR